MEIMIAKIKDMEEHGITNISAIALVSDTSSEVIFYGDVEGKRLQSNDLVEKGKVRPEVMDHFYDDITKAVRTSDWFKSDKMNIIKADRDSVDVTYVEKQCRVYKIIKEWEDMNR